MANLMGISSKHPSNQKTKGWILRSLPVGKGYGVAICATTFALLLRLSLDSYLGDRLAYTAFLIAIAVTTWYSGLGPSLMAVALGGLLANWIFIQPRYSLDFGDLEDQAGIAVYLTVSFALVGFAQTWRWAWKRTEEMTQELRMEIDRHRQTEEKAMLVGLAESIQTSQPEQKL